MNPLQPRNRQHAYTKEIEYDNDSLTSATLDESFESSHSSDGFPLDSPLRRKKRQHFADKSSRSDLEQYSNTNTIYLLSALAIFFYMQAWRFRSIGGTHPTKRPLEPLVPFNTVNPNIDWCPKATCHNSPLCHPCNRKFLIVIATGRSGSTTLTNMLHQLPGVRMAGENNGHLTYGFHEMKNLEKTPDLKLHSRTEIEGAWRHHPIPEQSTACPIQKMFESMNPPPQHILNLRNGFDDSDEILGFKTVRFHDEKQFGEDYQESVDFLIETFPCARFIINIRGDVEAQKSSWFKAFGKEMDENVVRKFNQRLVDTAAYLGQDRARLVDMSEWSKKDGSGLSTLNNMIEWLGFKDCRFQSLLHSNKNGYGTDDQKYSLGENCQRIGR